MFPINNAGTVAINKVISEYGNSNPDPEVRDGFLLTSDGEGRCRMTWQHGPEIAVALDLVGKAYEAAAEPELWPPFLNALADATDCDGTIIWLHDAQDESALLRVAGASFVSNVRFEPEFLKTYAEYYTHRNVLLRVSTRWAKERS